jgi:hypothetical protein
MRMHVITHTKQNEKNSKLITKIIYSKLNSPQINSGKIKWKEKSN